MNEPKRRGRSPKLIALPVVEQQPVNVDDVISSARAAAGGAGIAFGCSDEDYAAAAQSYALRVWHGQSESAPREWRVQRVREALADQCLPFDGVILP